MDYLPFSGWVLGGEGPALGPFIRARAEQICPLPPAPHGGERDALFSVLGLVFLGQRAWTRPVRLPPPGSRAVPDGSAMEHQAFASALPGLAA